mmetsp:Transcript_62782/g.99550  ORF Transcript_62782/g.99550 Transcript_62782/m.99550 type:complete len:341 (+) Transcript_62782:124-1146(+)
MLLTLVGLLAVFCAAEEDDYARQRLPCSDNILPHERAETAPALLQMKRRAPAHFVRMQAAGSSTLDSLNESEVSDFFVAHNGRENAHFEPFVAHHEKGAHDHHDLLADIKNAKERTSVVAAANILPQSEDTPSSEIKIAKVEMEPVQVGGDYKVKDGLMPFQVTNMSMKEMNDMSKVIMQLVAWLLFGNMVIILVVCIWQAFSPRRKALAASAELSSLSNEDQVTRSPQITSLAQLSALAQADPIEQVPSGLSPTNQLQKADGVQQTSPGAGIDTDIVKLVSSTGSPSGEDARRRSSSRTRSSRSASRRRSRTEESPKVDARCLRTVDALCTPSTTRRSS